MLVKFTEICNNGAVTARSQFILREIFVNPEHVVMIREDNRMRELNESGAMNIRGSEELNRNHRFSKLTINRGHSGTEIVVVGEPHLVESKLKTNSQQLLRG
jgi:hypothetical protein